MAAKNLSAKTPYLHLEPSRQIKACSEVLV